MADDDEGSGPLPVITNVVASVDLGCPIDLVKLFKSGYRYIEFTNQRFTKVVTLHLPGSSTIGRVFQTGKMMVLREITNEGAKVAAQKLVRIIQKGGFKDAKFQNFEVVNIFASWELEFGINLVELKEELGNENCTYDEQRPQVMYYKMKEPEMTLNIYGNGKVMLLGGKRDQDVYQACKSVYQILRKHRQQEQL